MPTVGESVNDMTLVRAAGCNRIPETRFLGYRSIDTEIEFVKNRHESIS